MMRIKAYDDADNCFVEQYGADALRFCGGAVKNRSKERSLKTMLIF
jgi:hypothetical protein